VKVAVRAPNGRTITPTINVNPSGGSKSIFDVTFTPTTPGEHKVDVLLNDKPNKGTYSSSSHFVLCKINFIFFFFP
jgi:hypothetical protein